MIQKENLLQFYIAQIQDNFYPYWANFEDAEMGGVLNCINNNGDEKLSDNKFTWSQGRWLWVLGRLHDLCKQGVFPAIESQDLERQMQHTYRFLTEKSIYDNNICCYLLDRAGNKLVDERTGRYDASIFADCFALIGMAQYTKTMELLQNVPSVQALYASILQRVRKKDFLTEPYPIPEGYQVHSIPMILVNVVDEVIQMKQRLGLDCAQEMEDGKRFALQILHDFAKNGFIREHVSTDENHETQMLDRHVNPGHTLEDMWFLGEFLQRAGEGVAYLETIKRIACNAFDLGWDEQYGGLLRFVDKDGGEPTGEMGEGAFERLIRDTWDMKLWWPHSEALYTLLYLYEKTGDETLMARYEKAERYVFETFPNKELGEWIQIRKRDGSPQDKLVALPVKDPFHIMRNFIKIIELYCES